MIAILNTINSSILGGSISLAPKANFEASVTTVPDEGTIDFTDLSTVPGGGSPITSWSWTFEGGTPSTSTAQNPTGIQYLNPGSYNVTLEVTNLEGVGTKVIENYITVTDATIVADFTSDTQTPIEGNQVQFTDASYGDTAEAWSWSFPGGTPATSTLQNPTVQYDTPGTYDVTLEVFDETSSSSITKPNYIAVQVLPVVADFSADDTTPTTGGLVSFTDLSSGTPTEWSWLFPGGTPDTSSEQNPAIQYNTIGTYSVSLTASKTGSSDDEVKTDYITVSEPFTKTVETFGELYSIGIKPSTKTVETFSELYIINS